MKDTWNQTYHYFHGDKDKGNVLMLHGFPSERYNSTPIEKNYDIGLEISKKGFNVLLPHYDGLGRNNNKQFSFESSFQQVLSLSTSILKESNDLVLFGHSWGGYLALLLNSIFKTKIKSTILLSPYIFLPSQATLEQTLNSIISNTPTLKNVTRPKILAQEIFDMDSKFLNEKSNFISSLKNITIFHAANDDEIPLSSSEKAFSLNENIHLNIFDTDHGFIKNREQFLRELLKAFN